jgi:hypothetical protein
MRRYGIPVAVLVALGVAGYVGYTVIDPQGVVSRGKKRHREYVGTKPRLADVAGTYVLSDQTVIPGGLSALGGRQCVLNVFADGSFSITNYPECVGASSSDLTQFTTFHSATGTWELGIVGTSYGYGRDPKKCWGLGFHDSSNTIHSAAFTGPEPPYGLLTILGDPDSNDTLRFKRKE